MTLIKAICSTTGLGLGSVSKANSCSCRPGSVAIIRDERAQARCISSDTLVKAVLSTRGLAYFCGVHHCVRCLKIILQI